MSIVTAVRSWFTKEVSPRVLAVEARLEKALSDIAEKEAQVTAAVKAFLEDTKTAGGKASGDILEILREVGLEDLKKAVIAEVLTVLKAEGVQLTEAVLEKYGVPSQVAEPVAETIVKTADAVVEAVVDKIDG